MVHAACHCTAVRFEIAELPSWVLECNCTICRRYGAIWAYPSAGQVKIVGGEGATETYVWGDRELAFHRCKECGCVTHMSAIDPPQIYGINVRMIPVLDPASVHVRQKDNGHTGHFWTRSDSPPEASRQPKIDPSTGDNVWR
jgi:hypothetical protein